MPFKCGHCHDYEHFQKQCPKLQANTNEKEAEYRWQQAKKPRGNPKVPATKAMKSMKDGKKDAKVQLLGSESENNFAILRDQEKEQETPKDPEGTNPSHQKGKEGSWGKVKSEQENVENAQGTGPKEEESE